MSERSNGADAAEAAMFLIGAGFSRSLLSRAPLNRDLLAELVTHHAPVLERCSATYGERDIERLLTRIDLDCDAGSALPEEDRARTVEDRRAIDGEIAGYFRTFRLGRSGIEVLGPALEWATMLLRPNDCIISLNYDCLLEGLLDRAGVWTPNGGYGGVKNILAHRSVPPNPRGITVYKIHGSENFVESRLKRDDEVRQTVIGFEIDASLYPNSSKHYHYGGGGYEPRRYIIAPSFVKVPHVDIAAMMIDLEDRVATCRHFVVIGCSLRREDSFLWLLLTRFLNRQLSKPMSLTIVDPHPGPIMDRIRGYWVGDVEETARVILIENSWVSAVDDLRRALTGAGEL